MNERSENGAPLPRDWLPDPQLPEGAPEWDARTQRIMAAADLELRCLRGRGTAPGATWWSVVARLWKPAAALAAASTALLVLVGRPAVFREPPPGSIPLALVASNGDPVTFWGSFGIQADPVLARIAVQERADEMDPGAPPRTPEEDNR